MLEEYANYSFGDRVKVIDSKSLFHNFTGIIVDYVGYLMWKVYIKELNSRIMFHQKDIEVMRDTS